jgi:hypothetical protein
VDTIVRKDLGIILCVLLFQNSSVWGAAGFPGLENYFDGPHTDIFVDAFVCDVQGTDLIEPESLFHATMFPDTPDVKSLPMLPGSASLFLYAMGGLGVWKVKKKRIKMGNYLRAYFCKQALGSSIDMRLTYKTILCALWCLYVQLYASGRSDLPRTIRVRIMGKQIFALAIYQPRSPPELSL